jgi:tetratricopeptide (TPR) repeat protein
MNLLRNTEHESVKGSFCAMLWFAIVALLLVPKTVSGGEFSVGEPAAGAQAVKLLNVGQTLAEKTQYLEALDLLQEARDLLEGPEEKNAGVLGDVLFALAQTRIKARLHQNFPAHYVKIALEEVQASNKLREQASGTLPQKLAEGYFLEGFIHKKFFLRKEKALYCFRKALRIDPGLAAAKRELSELIVGEERMQN